MIKYIIISTAIIGLVLTFRLDALSESIGNALILISVFGAMWYINQNKYE